MDLTEVTVPMSGLAEHDLEPVHDLIRTHLRQEYGLHWSSKPRHGRTRLGGSASGASFLSRTPGKTSSNGSGSGPSAVFGRPLRDLPMMVAVSGSDDQSCLAPHIAMTLCQRLEATPGGLATEGIFRKSGSALRQKELRAALERPNGRTEGPGEPWSDAQVLDMAALLKQWLREMPEPLIPFHFHKTMVEATRLSLMAARESLMLLTCLLPPHHRSTLKYLCQFFHRVAQESALNKMDVSNLAIVLTPTLFPWDDPGKVKAGKTDEHLAAKTKVLDYLFRYPQEIGILTGAVALAYRQVMELNFAPSDDNLDTDGETGLANGLGPMARRRRKLKRRSGSLSRVLTATMRGIQKAVYRSTSTPGSVHKRRGGEESYHCTPLPQSQRKGFVSPRLPLKRKADKEHEASPPKSKSKRVPFDAASAHTPKMRSGSFSIKKFKRKKSLKESCLLPNPSLINFSPLPSKPSVLMVTPGTPQSMVDISAAKDLDQSQDTESPSMVMESDASVCSNSQPHYSRQPVLDGSSSSFRKPPPPPRSDYDTPDLGTRGRRPRRSRSPSERKIGQMRRRSHDAGKKLASSSQECLIDHTSKELQVKPSMTNVDAQDMRAQLKLGRNYAQKRHGASPLKGVGGGLRSKSLASMRNKESISDLRRDINSFIEKSFSADISGISKLDEDIQSNDTFENSSVKDLADNIQQISVAERRDTLLRRQSSAFEFSRALSIPKMEPHEMRRQSSAFEIARRFEGRVEEPLYENFERKVPTRSSLRRKNSSVKDLVKQIETSRVEKKPSQCGNVSSGNEGDNMGFDEPLDEWVDAKEFFMNPASARSDVLSSENGCKRSSIIKIRQENKGLVSKTKATFAKPQLPPKLKVPPTLVHTTPNGATTSRRLSARMGVSTAMTTCTPKAGSGSTPFSSSKRRQTLTGIRTSVKFKPVPPFPYQDVGCGKVAPSPNSHHALTNQRPPKLPPRIRTTPAQSGTPVHYDAPFISRKPKGSDRKTRRHEEKRHLTIGYSGEVRSPLRERQNIVPTVQRSKSAQTPLQRKAVNKKTTAADDDENNSLHPMVRRSQSMRDPEGNEENLPSPAQMSGGTPNINSVKRHHSERTPKERAHLKRLESRRKNSSIHSAYTPMRGHKTVVKI
ncbi:uncharacterized protein LOC131887003 [Tigriopus californicus]|uniref:uncharacterized protein LOC131887003 n=1 Tax=Tigriopus californicus TaxID=6832 RepID=UPI0027D9D923|nr:uncharacterized protein LOC131887003 [Tigriopus californicus]